MCNHWATHWLMTSSGWALFTSLRVRPQRWQRRRWRRKLNMARLRLRRVGWMKLPWDLRQQLVAGNAIASLTWCPIGQPHDLRALRAMDLVTLHTMFATNPKALQKMAKEIFWTNLVRGHRLSAEVARTFNLVVALRRLRPQYQEKLRRIWQTEAGHRPVHPQWPA